MYTRYISMVTPYHNIILIGDPYHVHVEIFVYRQDAKVSIVLCEVSH